MKKSFVIFFAFSIILLTSFISDASATKGWVQSNHVPYVRHTAANPGNTKICGDHICKPFENPNKQLQVIQNHPTTDKTFNKIFS